MPTLYKEIKSLVASNHMDVEGTALSFTSLDGILTTASAFDRRANSLVLNRGVTLLLEHLACLGLKPAFTDSGYQMVNVDSPNLRTMPKPFMFSDSPFTDRPSKSMGGEMYPLLRGGDDPLFTHNLRWFKHPVRQGLRVPLRMSSYEMRDTHPQSRSYVDLPVVFKDTPTQLSFIRISLVVFEQIYFACVSGEPAFIKLQRTKKHGQTHTDVMRTSHVLPQTMKTMWDDVYENQYMPFYKKSLAFLSTQPKFADSAVAVADHLINFEH